MNSRSLLPAAFALLVGISIGVVFKPDFFAAGLRQEPARSTPARSARPDSFGSAPAAMLEPDSPASSRPELARSSQAPSAEAARQDESESSQDGFAFGARLDAENGRAVYRDDTFGPDEASLVFPTAVDEAGAAADYAEYGDGPLRRDATRPTDRPGSDERGANEPDQEFEADACLPPFSACRKDSDCCGSSVCRSRPGTISGYFECTVG